MEDSISNSETVQILPKENLKDKFNLVYLIIFCTGIGILIPWNYFITAEQYFKFKLIPELNSTQTDRRHLFVNYLAIFSMIPSAVTNGLNPFLRYHITPMRRFNFGVSIMFAMFLLTLVLTKVKLSPTIFFWITMATVAILNICSGIIQGSSMGIVSMMPGRYIKGFMEGQSLSGILASVSNIISIAAASQPDESAFMYFIIALVIMIFSGVGFCSLGKITFSQKFVFRSMVLDSSLGNIQYGDDIHDSGSPASLDGITCAQRYLPLLGRIYWFALSSMMTFLVTLTVFPSFTSSIVSSSTNPLWKDKYFTPVVCFLFINVSDYIGRFLCGYINYPTKKSPKSLFLASMLRWILVPLIFLCQYRQPKSHFSNALTDDVYPIILMWILGVSNGYILTLSFIYAPDCVNDDEKEAVGTLMSLFASIGLSLGVAISYGFRFLI